MTDAQRSAKVGDFVEIVANTNEHAFEIGQVVAVTEFYDFDIDDAEYGVECVSVNGGEHWFVRHTDYRITEHPSEYDRLRAALDEANQTIEGLHESLKVVASQRDTLRDILATQYNDEIDYDDPRLVEYGKYFEGGDSE